MTKAEEIDELIKKNSYSKIKGYSGVHNKLSLVCNHCSHPRNVLPKSFIMNPTCKICQKKAQEVLQNKKKITDMNISLRRKAKKIGFKITDWFNDMPKSVIVQCRKCSFEQVRAVNSLRNGLVCFSCKNKKKKIEQIDPEDIPYLISYVIEDKSFNHLSEKEIIFIKEFKMILLNNNLRINLYDKSNDVYLTSNKVNKEIKEFKFQKSFRKKTSIGNSLKDIFPSIITKLNSAGTKTSLQEIETNLSKSFFYKNLLNNYLKEINALSKEEIQLFYKKLIPSYSLVLFKQKLSFVDFNKTPSKVKALIKDDNLVISFDNFISFSMKIVPRENKDTINHWNQLLQECWTLL